MRERVQSFAIGQKLDQVTREVYVNKPMCRIIRAGLLPLSVHSTLSREMVCEASIEKLMHERKEMA